MLSVFTGGSNPGSASITVHGAFPNNRIAKRSPNSYVYAPYFPPLQHNITQRDFYGGNFWDARATGYRLQNSAAEQGQDPPVDPKEMANPDTACAVWKLSLRNYKFFFEQVWGTGSLDIAWPSDVSTKHSPVDRVIAAAPTHDPVQITAGPELETVNDTLAIIRWTSTKPGGTDLHYGIVHYGTDATNLSQVAKSPNRRNSSHPDMIFRVRVAGLKPQTTYYYTVESTSATAVNDGVSSRIRTFKTR